MSEIERRTVELLAEGLLGLGKVSLARRELKTIGRELPHNFQLREAVRLLIEQGLWENALLRFAEEGQYIPTAALELAAVRAIEATDVKLGKKLFELAGKSELFNQTVFRAAVKILREGDYTTALEMRNAIDSAGEFAFPSDALIEAATVALECKGLEDAKVLYLLAAEAEFEARKK